MGNAGLNESQSGIKIARRNINNLRYADDTTLMAETKEELNSLIFFLKSLLMKVKEESGKSLLNTQRSKNKDHGIWSHHFSWQREGETMETMTNFLFLGSKVTVDGDCSHEIKRRLLLEKKAMTNTDNVLKSRDTWCWKTGQLHVKE